MVSIFLMLSRCSARTSPKSYPQPGHQAMKWECAPIAVHTLSLRKRHCCDVIETPCNSASLAKSSLRYIYVYIYVNTHTHTHTHIYMYIKDFSHLGTTTTNKLLKEQKGSSLTVPKNGLTVTKQYGTGADGWECRDKGRGKKRGIL